MAKKGIVVPPVHRRIRHEACPGPVEGGKQRGRMDSCLRRNDGGGGDHPAPFTAEGAESAEGEEDTGVRRRWRKRAGNVASRCILLHSRLLLSSCEALE